MARLHAPVSASLGSGGLGVTSMAGFLAWWRFSRTQCLSPALHRGHGFSGCQAYRAHCFDLNSVGGLPSILGTVILIDGHLVSLLSS